MEIDPPEDPHQQRPTVTYQPVQDHDHTLACIRADVYELSPATQEFPAKWDLKCSSEPVSLCYDSFRFMYRALCLKGGTELILNSCIMPDSKLVKTAPLFCTWHDERTKKYLGFGFKQEAMIDTFMRSFDEAKNSMRELLSHIVPINTNRYNQNEPWQPILLNYNVAVQPQPQPLPQNQPQQQNSPIFVVSSPAPITTNQTNPIFQPSNSAAIGIRKLTDSGGTSSKRGPGLDMSMLLNPIPDYDRRIQNRLNPDPEILVISKENVQLKQFITTNHAKTKDLKNEFETLKRRNASLEKSNDVLASNTNGLQTKCDDIERKGAHWKELAEKSDVGKKEKLEESLTKRKNHLANLLEQRDNFKNQSQQHETEISRLRSQEETLVTTLEELHVENKAVSTAAKSIQDDRLLIKTMALEQLKDCRELESKVEITVQNLVEMSVDIKKSVKKTGFIIDHDDRNETT